MYSLGSIQETLDATDNLIECLTRDKIDASDEHFMSKLCELRLEHKRTLSIIENFYYDQTPSNGHTDDWIRYDAGEEGYWNDFSGFAADFEPALSSEEGSYVFEDDSEVEERAIQKTTTTTFTKTTATVTQTEQAVYSRRFVADLLASERLTSAAASEPVFRARAVPPSTHLPLYDDLQKKKEDRRRFLKEHRQEILKESVQPFQFNKHPVDHAAHIRRCTSMDLLTLRRGDRRFHANPVPPAVRNASAIAGEQTEKEERRRERIRQRSNELLERSQLPASMQDYASHELSRVMRERRHRPCNFETFSHQPKINPMPDFTQLHRQLRQSSVRNKAGRAGVTIPKPFHLTTRTHPKHQHAHPKEPTRIKRSKSLSTLGNPVLVKQNKASALRNTAIKSQIVNLESRALDLMRYWERRQRFEGELRDRVSRAAGVSAEQHRRQLEKRLQQLREQQRVQKAEYAHELAELDRRLRARPTVIERQQLLVDRQAAQRRYRTAFADAGVSPPKSSSEWRKQLSADEDVNANGDIVGDDVVVAEEQDGSDDDNNLLPVVEPLQEAEVIKESVTGSAKPSPPSSASSSTSSSTTTSGSSKSSSSASKSGSHRSSASRSSTKRSDDGGRRRSDASRSQQDSESYAGDSTTTAAERRASMLTAQQAHISQSQTTQSRSDDMNGST